MVREAGLVHEAGWVPVHPGTLQTEYERVFAIWDVMEIKLPNGLMLPKAGVFAHAQAEAVSHNIAAKLTGTATRRLFDGTGSCFVEVGDGMAAYGGGKFYAEPAPAVTLRQPSRLWHWAKVGFEK